MKKKIKKCMLALAITVLFITGLLIVIILNPILTYGNRKSVNNYTLYHDIPLDPALVFHLDNVGKLLEKSELYNPNLKLDICLNDGSGYPWLMQKIRGRAFAWGFLQQNCFYRVAPIIGETILNLTDIDGNLAQLLTHEAVHCLQFNKLGFWKSNPLAKIPAWKWEGYPEYVARKSIDQKDLLQNIFRLMLLEKTGHNNWIQFADSTGNCNSVLPKLAPYSILHRHKKNDLSTDTC